MQTSSSNPVESCANVREQFSPYLDGCVSGLEMASIAHHLEACSDCAHEFDVLRAVQKALAEVGPAQPPVRLQARLREAIHAERVKGTHLPAPQRFARTCRAALAPFALQFAGGLALAVVLVGSITWLFAAPLAGVEANDERMTHMVAPRYLYSQVPPVPIVTRNDAPVLVDAKVDAEGRVYDYDIVTGPSDPQVRRQVEENLVDSVFHPATVFGTPVNGHVMLTYVGVSVHG